MGDCIYDCDSEGIHIESAVAIRALSIRQESYDTCISSTYLISKKRIELNEKTSIFVGDALFS